MAQVPSSGYHPVYTPHPHPEYGYVYDGSRPHGHYSNSSSTITQHHSRMSQHEYDSRPHDRAHPMASSSSSSCWGTYSPSASETSLSFEDSPSFYSTELPSTHNAHGPSTGYNYPHAHYPTPSRSSSRQPSLTDHSQRAASLVRGPSSAWSISNNRSIHLQTYNDARYHRACNEVIKQMARVRIPVHAAGSDMVLCLEGGGVPIPSSTQFRQLVAAHNPECPSVFSEIDRYIDLQDDEIRAWLKEGVVCTVGTDAILKAASKRRASRRSDNDTLLFVCLWCGLLTTTKGNLSNHIRAHLGFHISFCENCNFSSVTSTIPSRHRARCTPSGDTRDSTVSRSSSLK
ncbi:hypothetical protein BJ165DRAFT_1528006 [Panaeolus papilionaceus]|nr:hypothetical protein BJ165DRAFT_1528006 [Panaeolus papilionaceus]